MFSKLKTDKIHEECGIFGGYLKDKDIALTLKCGLLKLQHRGQDSAGISCGFDVQNVYKNLGLVNTALRDNELRKLKGSFGIAHVRYSTCGDVKEENIQPVKTTYFGEDVSLVHNGNVKQAEKIREEFEKNGEVFLSTSDSEVILKKIVSSLKKPPSKWTFEEIGECLLKYFSLGSYCILIYTPNRIFAFRDNFGYRPLMLAKSKEGFFVASEDIAFCSLSEPEIVEIKAGFGVEITKEDCQIKSFSSNKASRQCVFEHIYFANPASNIFSKNVYTTRIKLGELLAQSEENDFKADVVIPVMDSGFACALGYAQASKIPFHVGLVRNPWLERSFIQSQQELRKNNVRQKFAPIKEVILNKKVVLLDDSLVRGTTSREIVSMLKRAGAKEVHMRSSSPKIINTCFFGVDIPTKEELIAYNKTDFEIAREIGADSIKFLPFESLSEVFEGDMWCNQCFLDEVQK